LTTPPAIGTAVKAPTPPAPPAAPTANVAPAAQPAATTQKSWWPFGSSSGNSNAPAPSAAAPPPQLPKPQPVDPRQAAKGKVWGSQGDCQGQTGGHCVMTDCSTHVGGVCEGTKGIVWSYVH
jgi:hypothetical protein